MKPRALGVALMWWPELDALCRNGEGLVDAIELEPETFWAPPSQGRATRSHLGAAVAHLPQPKLLHGVAALRIYFLDRSELGFFSLFVLLVWHVSVPPYLAK